MRVCFVTLEFPPDWGGVSKSALRVVTMLAANGLSVDIFAPTCGATSLVVSTKIDCGGDAVLHRVNIPNDFSPAHGLSEQAIYNFESAIRSVDMKRRFDIFHGFYLPSVLACINPAEQGRRPIIASIRGDDAFTLLRTRREEIRKVLERADLITSVTTDGIIRSHQLVDIDHKSIFIPNSAKENNGRNWSAEHAEKGSVGTVCTFRPKKNIPLLVQAYALVQPRIRSRLRLVGDFVKGDCAGQVHLHSLISELNVVNEIQFSGYLDNAEVLKAVLSMNVFVISSDHEGFPNTLLEAASTGVPIVATNVDGIKDVVADSNYALLVPPGHATALSNAIEAVLQDEGYANELSRGSLRISSQFNWEREQRDWLMVYSRFSDQTSLDSRFGQKQPV